MRLSLQPGFLSERANSSPSEFDRGLSPRHECDQRAHAAGAANGGLGRRRGELKGKAQKVLAVLPCEPVPSAAADHYANVKLAQQRRGLPLDENGLWVAATALAIGATLVSSDSDFRRIDSLDVVVP